MGFCAGGGQVGIYQFVHRINTHKRASIQDFVSSLADFPISMISNGVSVPMSRSPGIPDARRRGRINREKRVGFFTYSSVHVSPFSAQHVSFLALRPSTGWHAR
jgi:hypothetical protein